MCMFLSATRSFFHSPMGITIIRTHTFWAVREGRYVCCMVLILHRRKSIFILIRHINDILFEGGGPVSDFDVFPDYLISISCSTA